MANESVRWGSQGGLQEEPPQRIKDFGYTTSTGDETGTSEAPILQWTNWQFAKTYEALNNLTDLFNEGAGSGSSGGSGYNGINLIVNGDFTGGTTNWIFNNGIAEFQRDSGYDTLSGYIGIWTPTANDSTMEYSALLTTPIEIQNQMGYLSFDYYSDYDGFAVELYQDYDLVYRYPIPLSEDWIHFKIPAPMPDAGVELTLKFVNLTGGDESSQRLYLNNIQLGSTQATTGSIITEFKDYGVGDLIQDPTGDGVLDLANSFYKARRVGTAIEVLYAFKYLTAPTGSSDLIFDLPLDLEPSEFSSNNNLGQWSTIGDTETGFLNYVDGSLKFCVNSLDGDFLSESIIEETSTYTGVALIPIKEWEGQGTLPIIEAGDSSPDAAGQMVPWAGTSEIPPNGWALCDGSILLKAKYPDLYAAIGDAYNTGTYFLDDGSISTYSEPGDGYFRLPDTRNCFLRHSNTAGSNFGTHVDDTTAQNGLTAQWSSSNATTNGNKATWSSSNQYTNENSHSHNKGSYRVTGVLTYISETWNARGTATGAFYKNTGYGASATPSNTDSSSSGRITLDTSTDGGSGFSGNSGTYKHSHYFNKDDLNDNQNSHNHTINRTQFNGNQSWAQDFETAPKHINVKYIIRLFNSEGNAFGLPLATEDNYGLSKKNVYQIKKLASNVTSPAQLFEFINLVVGKTYSLEIMLRSEQASNQNLNVSFSDGSNVINRILDVQVGKITNYSRVIFEASTTSVKIDLSTTTTIIGSGGLNGTFATLTELNDTEPTTRFGS